MGAEKQTILIADDDPHARSSLRSTLLHQFPPTVQVLEAETGRQVIQFALHAPLDLILLDDSLPELDGYTVCLELKRDPETAAIKVLLMAVSEARRARRAGADGVLLKPFGPGELLATVRQLLG